MRAIFQNRKHEANPRLPDFQRCLAGQDCDNTDCVHAVSAPLRRAGREADGSAWKRWLDDLKFFERSSISVFPCGEAVCMATMNYRCSGAWASELDVFYKEQPIALVR